LRLAVEMAHELSPGTEHIDAFMRGVRKLVVMLNKQLPGHHLAYNLHRKLVVATLFVPVRVVEDIGYYLMKYQDRILEGDESFFLEADFSEDLGESVDPVKKEDTAEMIPLVKECVRKMPKDEQRHYTGIVHDMLISFLGYRIAVAKARASAPA
jgi:hypothetical protein